MVYLSNSRMSVGALLALSLFASWNILTFLIDAFGLFVFFISVFALYSWIFSPQTALSCFPSPTDAFKDNTFILYKSKTWIEYANKRSNEIRQRAPQLVPTRPMRPASTSTISSDDWNRTDPINIAKYQKAAADFIGFISRDFIQSWFEKLSPSPTFSFKIESTLWFAFNELTRRFERVDFVQFIIAKFLPLCTTHMKEIEKAERLARGENLRVENADLDVLRCYRLVYSI